MDFWVVAAVAGAGYLARNWQSLSTVDKENSDELFSKNSIMGESNSRNLLEHIRDKTCPFRRLAQKREKRCVFSEQKDAVLDRNGEVFSARMAATSGSNGGDAEYVETDEYNVHQLARERSYGNMEFANADTRNNGSILGNGVDEYKVHWSGRGYFQESVENVDADSSNHLGLKRSKSLRSIRRRATGYVIRPLDSVESCLAAQLCREHERVEEYVYSSLHSASVPVLRPLLVTDGSRIISRGSIDSSSMRSNIGEDKLSDSFLGENDAFTRVPASHYHKGGPYKLQLKPRIDSSIKLARSSSNKVSGGPFDPPGPRHRMIPFFMGISIGILSILMANKREVEQLNKKLKQTQNLVQDLSEELEMKDVLTVRELTNEASQPERVDDTPPYHHGPSTLSYEQFEEISKYDGEKQDDPTVENSESRNNIEAELEAELERLELNLKASSQISNHVEVDPDQELAYYAVSPRELRLRLHEVIEAQLEVRIEELETALRSSDSRLHSLESQRDFTCSEAEMSSTPQSPMYMFQDCDKQEPLVINLAGNALDAYNEAYAEMLSMTDSDKETAQTLADGYHLDKETSPSGRKPSSHRSCRENDSTLCDFVGDNRISISLVRIRTRTSGDHTSRSLRSSENGNTDDEDNQELDMPLIVEKRSGANLFVCGGTEM